MGIGHAGPKGSLIGREVFGNSHHQFGPNSGRSNGKIILEMRHIPTLIHCVPRMISAEDPPKTKQTASRSVCSIRMLPLAPVPIPDPVTRHSSAPPLSVSDEITRVPGTSPQKPGGAPVGVFGRPVNCDQISPEIHRAALWS